MSDPLTGTWDGPLGLPDFTALRDAGFSPAFDTTLARARAEVQAIADTPEAPTFANTVEALEAAGEDLSRVASLFFVLAGADSTPERQALQRRLSPELAAFSSEIHGNKALFSRIEAVWQQRDDLGLDPEQARLLSLTRRRFLRAGAALTGEDDARMRAILRRLAELGTQFTQNLLADEAAWHMELSEDDLEGLPDFVVQSARAAGHERGLEGPAITLSRSLIVPFLQFSPRRALRERAFRAWVARGAGGGETDNRAIAAEILALREERAHLLGYENFAAYKLEPEMAHEPARVRDLLMQVWDKARARALGDQAALTDAMQADGINDALRPWDWRYYASRRRQAMFDLDETALKPYLSLDAMREAAFAVAGRLFGLNFTPLDAPLYHPDCRAWQVTRGGRHVAVFIADYFARPSKRSGAWCTSLQAQATWPRTQAPIVLNVCNFAKGDPLLLSYDDARTLFHEFGHALHHMLSDVRYGSMSGTSVARDFVELPSQLYEHWLEVPQVLERHARHYRTGAAMPTALLEKMLAARNADQGFETVEYLASALVDLDFHERPAPADPMARQAEVLAGLGMPEAIVMRHATPHFAHVFSGDGYSSGYYSYMWSEVMDADAFAAFEEAGDAFDAATAQALEGNILSRGGTAEAETLYTAFRGRMPGVDALLKGRGLD